jgi:hypothetical protein
VQPPPAANQPPKDRFSLLSFAKVKYMDNHTRSDETFRLPCGA